jgi:hypothetical protein
VRNVPAVATAQGGAGAARVDNGVIVNVRAGVSAGVGVGVVVFLSREVWGLGFGAWGLGFGVWGLGLGV